MAEKEIERLRHEILLKTPADMVALKEDLIRKRRILSYVLEMKKKKKKTDCACKSDFIEGA